jgi:hypothetical protein
MPTYTFRNNKTGEEWTEIMNMSEREEVLKDKDIEQLIVSAPPLVDPVGLSIKGVKNKPDGGFRDLLKTIKKGNSKGFQKSSVNTF